MSEKRPLDRKIRHGKQERYCSLEELHDLMRSFGREECRLPRTWKLLDDWMDDLNLDRRNAPKGSTWFTLTQLTKWLKETDAKNNAPRRRRGRSEKEPNGILVSSRILETYVKEQPATKGEDRTMTWEEIRKMDAEIEKHKTEKAGRRRREEGAKQEKAKAELNKYKEDYGHD